MLEKRDKQQSIYSIIYNKIPDDHLLKKIDRAVDFSFVNDMFEDSYCKYYGRPAKEPEMMIKLLILQYLYKLSDREVIRNSNLNIAYMWFLGINPEEDLPDPSLLAKFRTGRLKKISIDQIMEKIIKQCIDNGIIKETKVSIDSTHTETNTKKKVPERIMKHLARKIIKEVKKSAPEIENDINTEIPNYKEIEDHKIAKETMKNYLTQMIKTVKQKLDSMIEEKTELLGIIEEAKEILEDPKFIQQKGIRSLIDKDARVGRKSKTDSFYGFKTEMTMLAEEKIILTARVNDGAYVDGKDIQTHLDKIKNIGVKVEEFYGDKAYFRGAILESLEKENITPYIPVSASAYKINEDRYSYNKDADIWMCKMGNESEKKKYFSYKTGRKGYKYYFKKEVCKSCSIRNECIGEKRARYILVVALSTPKLYEYSQKQKTPEFLKKFKSRASIENKNAELKVLHGMAKARGFGLKSVETQVKLTVLAVNLKRIAKLFSEKLHYFLDILAYLIKSEEIYTSSVNAIEKTGLFQQFRTVLLVTTTRYQRR